MPCQAIAASPHPGGPPGPRVAPLSKDPAPPKHLRVSGNSPGGMLFIARDLHGNRPANVLGSVDLMSPVPPGLCWNTTKGPGNRALTK
jgi:hypothetical protein